MANEVDTNDVISVMNRLDFLSEKSRSGTPGIGPDKGKVFKGGLTPEENAEYDKLFSTVEQLLKSSRPVYGIKNPDGTTTLSYTNPTAKEEEAYRQQYGANTSLAQAGTSPYSGGKVLTWAQKQEAMKRVEELRPKYASLPYSQQQEFDAIQRNLYASMLVNKDNPNPPEANATSIYENTPELIKQSNWGPSPGVQVGAAPGSMPGATPAGPVKTLVTQTKDSNGSIINKYSDGSTITVTKNGTVTSTDGTTSNANNSTTDANIPAGTNPETAALIKSLQTQITSLTKQVSTDTQVAETAKYNERMSVYSTMADRFNKYGLNSLANKIKELAIKGATEATITLELQETPEYQQRFAANADRLKKGLSVLTPADYVRTEDAYRQVLRAYGLKQFDNDAYVKQFLANDMSPTEFSNRIVTAVQRVQNADPAITKQLKDYYGIGEQDMVGYVLDPEQQFQEIERRIAAAEIGVAARRQGLIAGEPVARQLAAQGITEAQAKEGYANIAGILPTAEKLSDIYGTTLDAYRQDEAEQEQFNSLASAQRKRQKLTAREIAAFSGSSGTNKTSLTTSSVGQF